MSRATPTPPEDRLVFDFQPARRGTLLIPSDPARYAWKPDWDDSRTGHTADDLRTVVPDAVLDAAVSLDPGQPALIVSFPDAVQPRSELTMTAWLRWDGRPGELPESPQSPDMTHAALAVLLKRQGVELRVGDDELGGDLDLSTPPGTDTDDRRDGAAGEWRHVTLRWDGDAGHVDLRIDGEEIEVHRTGDEDARASVLPFRRGVELVLGIAGETADALRVGPVRLHARLRSDAELLAERYADLSRHPGIDEQSPLAFRVADALDDPHLYVTDDDVAGRTLHIVIENRSRFRVALPEWDDEDDSGRRDEGSPEEQDKWERYLELRFRPGCLTGGARHWVEAHAPGWRVGSRGHEDGGVSLYVARTEPMRLDPGQTAALTLHHVRASGDLGAHGTHLELLYAHPHHEGIRCSRISVARVVGQRGRRRSPLRFGVVGNGTVLNDGVTANSLDIYVANTSRTHPVTLRAPVGGVGSALVLSFDAGEPGDDWALATVDELLAADVRVLRPDGTDAGWLRDVETLGESPEWVLSPTTDMQIEPGKRLTLQLANLKTDLPAGRTRAYLRFSNIPGYWDDDRTLDLTKSRVQIDPAGLHVHGDLTLSGKLVGDLTLTGRLFDDLGELLPAGVILMWSGSADEIPAGWALCDGSHDTPDLSDRFVLSKAVKEHAEDGGRHDQKIGLGHLPPHLHRIDRAFARKKLIEKVEVERHRDRGLLFGTDLSHDVRVTTTECDVLQPGKTYTRMTGYSQPFDNRPRFYALCFIMKRYGPDDPVKTLPPPPPPVLTA